MNILSLIKKSSVIRKYKARKVSPNLVNKIIQAGIWSLSVHGFQPWNFVVIRNKKIINRIADISEKKAFNLFAGTNMILRSTAHTIRNAPILIAIYNDGKLSKFAEKLKNPYTRYARITEIQSIGAAIQNMFLEANSLGVGAAWLSAPLFCREKISNLLNEKMELIALLLLGYQAGSMPKRGRRKDYSKTVKIIT